MINFGIVGIGFMGVTHYKAIQKVRGAKVGAIVSRDAKKLQGDWRNIQGNFGGSGGTHDLSKVRAYKQLDKLLDDPNIDVVDICLPTPMHVETSLRALQSGKHVFLEKPISLTIADANKLVSAAKRYGKSLMVAHVLRYFPEFRLLKQLVDLEEYGRVRAAHFKRIISKPSWWDPNELDRTGGPAIDLHIHDTDFLQFVFGMPDSVVSQGTLGKRKVIEYIHTLYKFPKNISISAEGGWLAQSGCPFEHGYDVYFEDATLKFNSLSGQSPQLLTNDGKVRKPRLSRTDGFVGELQEVTDAIRENRKSIDLDATSARNSLDICLKEIRSVHQSRRILI
jgi:predicted dehydrogenase